jgi:hypothetical protein
MFQKAVDDFLRGLWNVRPLVVGYDQPIFIRFLIQFAGDPAPGEFTLALQVNLPFRARRGFEQLADVDRIHPSGADGLEAQVGVFKGAAVLGGHADAAGGFEEDVGSGFLADDIFVGDDGLEEVADLQLLKNLLDNGFAAAGSDGHGQFAEVFLGDGDDELDGLDLGKEGKVRGFFLPGDGEVVEVNALFGAEHLEDIARGNAAEGVEAVLREVDAVALEDGLPGLPMERHGIGQGAVAIKD